MLVVAGTLFAVPAFAYVESYNGQYTGNGTGNQAIAHNLSGQPDYVYMVLDGTSTHNACTLVSPGDTYLHTDGGTVFTVTAMDSTNFYVGAGGTSCNGSGSTYNFTAYRENGITPASFPTNASGYLKNDGAGALTWDNASTVKTFLSLGNVENTALSTWEGSTYINTLGTIGGGTWEGAVIQSGFGGTGFSSYGDGEILIGDYSGSLLRNNITAGANITVTNGDGTIEIAASGGGSLPPDAAGWLENDGAGTLSWSDPGTGGTTVNNIDTMYDATAILLYFGCFAVFLAVAFYKNK